MQEKVIKAVIRKKFDQQLESITNEDIRKTGITNNKFIKWFRGDYWK